MKVIASLQTLGGITILVSTVKDFASVTAIPVGWVFTVFFGFLSIFAIYASFELWRGTNKGIAYSIPIQCIQILTIDSRLFSYLFYFGAVSLFKLSFSPRSISFDTISSLFGSRWNISYFSNSNEFTIGINLVALLAFIYLSKVKRSREKAEAQEKAQSFKRLK